MWFDPGSKPAGKHTCMCKTAVTKVTAVLLGLALYRKSKLNASKRITRQ